ncbi:MAG: ATP-binding protein, partial [Pseudomonadota bacterium]|nr:ATP-binding protein [Pseudomonadota bacterium]
LRAAIPAAFESDDYRSRKSAIEDKFKELHEHALEGVQSSARERDIALIRTPEGLGFAPMTGDKVIEPEAFQALPDADRKRLQKDVESLQEELQAVLVQLPALVKQSHQQIADLDREITRFATGHLIDDLQHKFDGLDDVRAYLDAVRKDVVENATIFLPRDEAGQPGAVATPGRTPPAQPDAGMDRYAVNLLVDCSGRTGAPVIYEDHPTYQRLVGEIEHISQMGALTTNFTLIKPGALHRANGGTIIVDARKLLQQPLSYDALKQALQGRRIRIEAPGQALSMVSTRGLEPEPIPLDVKVVLIGEPTLYYTLTQQDPEFGELFKVAADFEDQVERTDDNAMLYAQMIAERAREADLKPLDRGVVARILEHGSRMAADAERLSVRVGSVTDLMREADYWCTENGAAVIKAGHVQQALDAQVRRANRMQERMAEQVTRGTILIDTDGAEVGQINGLSVLQLGSFGFGKPTRITARVRLGKGEVIDIEREVELGGPLHSKGVLILSGYLGARFAEDRPLSLAVSLVFEQSYGGVDGDSASSTELYAILSALSGVPIRQGLAVTGSVNQRGEVQAIGGVNEKIEGFFDLCQSRGLTGEQGVMIPAANVKHLMLRSDVVAAAMAGQFRIYPIATIDQGIACLTGVAAGERGEDGQFPDGTINQLVEAKLASFAAASRRHSSHDDGKAPS